MALILRADGAGMAIFAHDSLLIAIVDRSFSVFIHVCDLLPFCVNENRTQTILRAVFWRRCGDLNPSAGGTDLPHSSVSGIFELSGI